MWLGDTHLAMASLILMALAGGQGAAVILICASMGRYPPRSMRRPPSTVARWQQFLRITIPLIKPTLLYLTIINTVHSFQVFTQIYMMTNGGPFYATTTVVHRDLRECVPVV